MTKLEKLKERLFELETTMVNSYSQQSARNKEMFLLNREIEKLESPDLYEENKNHWEGHESRF